MTMRNQSVWIAKEIIIPNPVGNGTILVIIKRTAACKEEKK
jgi:hypothetical protein